MCTFFNRNAVETMLRKTMTLFQEFIIRKQIEKLAEICYEANVELQPFLNELEKQDSHSEESLSRLAEAISGTIGNALGAAGGFVNPLSKIGTGINQGNPNTVPPQQAAAKSNAMKTIKGQLDALYKVIPQLIHQLQVLGM